MSAVAVINTVDAVNYTAINATTTNATTTNLATSNLRISTLDCTGYANGGKLTTDDFGNVTCGTDNGGAGSSVGGANAQVQFNDAGSFGGDAGFTYDKNADRVTVPNASTTNLTASYASSTQGFFGALSAGTLSLGSALSASFGGTGISNPGAAGVLVGEYGGGSWQQLATSSLGLLTTNVAEGSNFYFTNNRVAGVLAGTTTDALAQGSTNRYYATNLFAADLAGTSTDALREGASNLYFTTPRVQTYVDSLAKGYFFATTSADYWDTTKWRWATTSQNAWEATQSRWATSSANYFESTQTRWATTSSDYWLTVNCGQAFSTTSANAFLGTKSTDDIAQGSANKYYATAIFATDLAATTTDALREGGTNKYYTDQRADARINATSSIGTLTSAPNLGTVATTLTGFLKATAGALSTAAINLASDITGILPVGNGGTGWANIAASAIPYGSGAGALATTTAGTGGYVLAYLNGVPAWTATTTFSAPLSYSGGAVSIPAASGGTNGYLSSTDWNAFSTKFATSSSDFWLSQYAKGFFFSTTSASAWDSLQFRWATTSTAYWDSTQFRWATTSADYESGKSRWATTSPTILSQNQGAAFSTTSANYLLNSSTTIPRTTLGNMWTSLQTFANGFISNASSTFTTGLLSMNGGASTTNFTASGNVALGNATTTNLFATNASSTNLFGAGLTLCQGGNVLTWANGIFGCAVDQSGAGGGAWPFTSDTNYGVAVQSTSTPIWATAGLMASSTSYFVNASSTAFTVSGTAFFGTATSTTLYSNSATIGSLTAGTLSLNSLGTLAGGFLSQASSTVAGLLTTLNSSSSLATLGTLWLPNISNALLSTDNAGKLVATSTPTATSFIATGSTASQFPYASSTALTVSGVGYFGFGAFTSSTGTTTIASGQGLTVGGSQFVVQQGSGNVGVGTASPGYVLDVNGDVNVASGSCFRVGGVCIGYVVKLAAIYATSTPSGTATSTVVFTGAQGSAPTYSGTTLTLSSNTSYIVAEVWGGGGGGGGASNSGTPFHGGSGGGGGAYSQKLYSAPSGTYYYYIGKGGAAASGGADNAGGGGGTSAFGTGTATSTATGGGGGSGAAAGANGGTAGTASGGDLNINGSIGEPSQGFDATYGATGGTGGTAPHGGRGGPGGGGGNGTGQAGAVFGGGGGGGGNNGAGGSGGSGGLVITIYATSSPTTAGNDYAEMFPVSNPGITAGDIVAVDAGLPVSMKLAAAGGSAPLAGIIATNPGQLLGDKEAVGGRPVALSGRVPAKVNLEGGPISIGDRIAPSSVPGVGKKAGPFDDSVGIALDSFSGSADASSQGSVTVFIDLQHGIDVNAIALKLLGWDNPAVAAGFASATSSESSGQSSPLDFVGGVMREIATRIDSLASTELTYTADATSTGMTPNDASSSPVSSTPADTFASGLLRSMFAQIARWLANAANGIESIFAKVGNFGKVNTDELCVGGTCISTLQFQQMVAAAGQSHAATNTNGSEEPPPMSSSPADATNTPPVIRINGNNSAHINIGDTYQDLGATAKDSVGHDLGVKTFLNGLLVSDIVIDTSTTTTDIIDYVASDTWGNTATATRSVIIEAPAAPVVDSGSAPVVVPDAPPLAPDTATSAPAASAAEIQPAPSASAIEPAAAPSDAAPVIE